MSKSDPHKSAYYLERRDPEFKQKMAAGFCASIARLKLIRRPGRRETRGRAMRGDRLL